MGPAQRCPRGTSRDGGRVSRLPSRQMNGLMDVRPLGSGLTIPLIFEFANEQMQ
jgi:hypothetical protein